jgi:hypothetical protein
MNASSNFKVFTSLLFIVLSQMSPPLAGPATKEKIVVATNVNLIAFSPRPEGVTETMTVSSPVVVINDEIAARLGGSGLVKMIQPCLENLLNNSGRFTVLLDGDAPYKIRATLTTFNIMQTRTKKDAAGIADFFKDGISRFGKNKFTDRFDPKLLGADWSKDEVVINVDCALSLQIMDRTSALVAGNEGRVTREAKTAAVRAELAGVTFTNGASITDGSSPEVEFPTRLIELAAFDSLNKSMAKIDQTIASRKSAPVDSEFKPTKETGEKLIATGGESPAIIKSRFCGQCGQKLESDDKFCSSCGKSVRK